MEGSSIDVPFAPSFLETPWKHGATACGEGARARRCIEAARGEPQNIVEQKIKGPDNPTSQLLPIMSFNGFSGDREGRKDKGGGERSRR